MKIKQNKIVLGAAAGVVVVAGIVAAVCCGKCCNQFAVIDLIQVVKADPAAAALRAEQNKGIEELSKWLDQAQAEIKAEKKKVKQAEMAQEYREIALKKQNKLKEEYSAKLKEIDDRLTAIMTEVAKDKGCSVILDAKSVVQGGLNITEDVIKIVSKK